MEIDNQIIRCKKLPRLNSDLCRMDRSKFSDTEIECKDGKRFPCHKFILSSRSLVFKAMFEHPKTLENDAGVVKIEDFDSDAISSMLHYVYTDTGPACCQSVQLIGNVYQIAQKYMLEGLQAKCQKLLVDKVDSRILGELVAFLNRVKDEELEIALISYMARHIRHLSNLGIWETIKISNQSLVMDALCYKYQL